MSIRAPLISGTALSLATVCAWSYSAALTIGTPAPLHLTRSPAADYARLASAATGNGIELFAAVAAIYTLCFAVSGLRRIRREAAAQRAAGRAYAEAEAMEHAAGWR